MSAWERQQGHTAVTQRQQGHPAGFAAAASRAAAAAMDEVATVADAVLFEGYLLYPYRASAQKNRLRWQFGVLTPAGFGDEPDRSRTEVLLERRPCATLHLRLRFLQLRARTVHDRVGRPIDELVADGERHVPWEEGVPREVDAELAVDEPGEWVVPFALPEERSTESVAGGHVERRCWPLTGRIVVGTELLPGPYDVLKLRVDVVNDSPCPHGARRDTALRTSLISAHTLLAVTAGGFLSATDPPEWARSATGALDNRHSWPVLAGPAGRSDLLLATPIILADHPQLAPESPTDLFDGTEIDEILSLRTLVLTDEEKAEVRATDPRAAAVVDAVDAMPPEMWERLHGAIRTLRPASATDPAPECPGGHLHGAPRPEGGLHDITDAPGDGASGLYNPDVPWWDPGADASVDPETDSVLIGGTPVARGSRVLLRPRPGGDVQDMFLIGMAATVQAVLHDVDGEVHLAVSVDGDPAAELQIAHGRFRYFHPDEIEVCE
ncbi:MAG: hypothetical protein QOK35_690 [Pseudonocardiales bacterium]|nr:hypothetical protein [Pseudonocardiales bacterium]